MSAHKQSDCIDVYCPACYDHHIQEHYAGELPQQATSHAIPADETLRCRTCGCALRARGVIISYPRDSADTHRNTTTTIEASIRAAH